MATAYDAYGNVAADDVVSVTLSVTGGSTPSGFVVNAPGANPVNTSAGVATFTNVAVRKVGTAYQLRANGTFNSTPLTQGTSSAFNITPGDPKSLTFTTNPISTYTADDSFGAVATAYDAYGNVAADDVVSVTLSVTGGSTPSGFVVNAPGANPVNTSAGVATFTNVAVRKVGTAYQLRANGTFNSTPLTQGTSSAFNITPGDRRV